MSSDAGISPNGAFVSHFFSPCSVLVLLESNGFFEKKRFIHFHHAGFRSFLRGLDRNNYDYKPNCVFNFRLS